MHVDDNNDVSNDDNDKYFNFKHGSIVRIELENFMIYKHIEFLPGPFLNLILGPNGSGKSALVCSIILGFGGDPQITGRSTNLIEYVRFGSNHASIIIELYNPQKTNHIIQREFRISSQGKRNECHTVWRLNGKTVKKDAILEFMKRMNIDVNNLCQVLPQERVVEFSKLNSKELLFSTEKSTGNIDMYEKHMQLIELSNEILMIETKIKETNSFLMKYNNFKSNIEPDLRLIQEKKRFEEQIEWLTKKQVWLEYDEKRLEYVKIQKQYTSLKKEYDQFISQIEPKRKRKEKSIKLYNQIQMDKSKNITLLNKYLSTLSNSFDSLNSLKDKLNEAIILYNEKQTERKNIQKRLQQYEQDYHNYKNDLNDHPKMESFISDLTAKRKKIEEIDEKIKTNILDSSNYRNQYDNMISEQRLLQNRKNEINNLFNVRLDKINQKDNCSRKAYEWYLKNKDNFSGQVFPPLITQINVVKDNYANAVEMTIGTTDMSTFLFEKLSDLEYFNENLKKDLNIRVNVAMLPEEDIDKDHSSFDIEPYKQYGIFARISDLFTAPKKIMSYLIKNYQINSIPVGNDITENRTEELINSSSFRRLITSKNLYSIVVSAYDGVKSTQIIPLHAAKYLNIIINEKEIEEINRKMIDLDTKIQETKSVIDNYNKSNDDLKSKRSELLAELKSIEMKKNELNKLEMKIQEKERQINAMKKSLNIDVNKFKIELNNEIGKISDNQIKLIERLPNIIEEAMEMNKENILISAKHKKISQLKSMAEIEYDGFNAQKTSKLNSVEELNDKLKECRRIAKDFRQKAIEKSGFDFTVDLDDNIREKINELPDTLDEISDAIDVLKLRCEGIKNVDQSLLEQYKSYQSEINNKTNELKEFEEKISQCKNQIDSLKPIWLDELKSLIDKINDNFSKFMSHLNYSGEVYLFTGEKEYSFDDYGIRIKVKFRDAEPMIDLDAYHQSGGERSVSTMIYMLSLQELAHVPFRVVDEINQGMDEINERCVFDLIADVSKRNSSQYFLLSPKLLTNLKYTNEMKIHIIFNSECSFVNWNKTLQDIINNEDDNNNDDDNINDENESIEE